MTKGNVPTFQRWLKIICVLFWDGKTSFYRDHLLVSGGRRKTQKGVGAALARLPRTVKPAAD